jgi:lactoylglutathione lyase
MLVLLLASSLCAQTPAKRPRILGIAHVAVDVSDLAKARAFYKQFLGFEEPFSLRHKDGSEWIAYVKINDTQYIELFAGSAQNAGQLDHIAFYTDDAAGMKDSLVSRGVKLVSNLHKGSNGDFFFSFRDPEGNLIEIAEPQKDSWAAQTQGNFLPAGRVSHRLQHIGIATGFAQSTRDFYRDVLGFSEISRKVASGDQPAFISMRVPDGEDYVDFILHTTPPAVIRQKLENHICLVSSSLQKTNQDLRSRPSSSPSPVTMNVQLGRPQMDLFDPDGTRIEIIEASPAAMPPQ